MTRGWEGRLAMPAAPTLLLLLLLLLLLSTADALLSDKSLRPATKSQASMCAAKKYGVLGLKPVTVNEPVWEGEANVFL